MKRALDNALLLTDFDANNFRILNLGDTFIPNLVDTNDPRLSDPRPVTDSSVTDAKVASDADIQQSKLNLDGDMPSFRGGRHLPGFRYRPGTLFNGRPKIRRTVTWADLNGIALSMLPGGLMRKYDRYSVPFFGIDRICRSSTIATERILMFGQSHDAGFNTAGFVCNSSV